MKNHPLRMSKVMCECGCFVGMYYLRKHKQTQKHLKKMRLISPPVEPSLASVLKEMDELEEKIDEMGSGEYLRECNRLKSFYDRLKRNDYIANLLRN